jgi:hypothetical protein
MKMIFALVLSFFAMAATTANAQSSPRNGVVMTNEFRSEVIDRGGSHRETVCYRRVIEYTNGQAVSRWNPTLVVGDRRCAGVQTAQEPPARIPSMPVALARWRYDGPAVAGCSADGLMVAITPTGRQITTQRRCVVDNT